MKPSPNELRAVFHPQVMGVLVLLVIALAFTVGILRRELALALAGAAFLLPWVYCLAMTLLLALLHRRRACRAFIRISPREVNTGELVEVVYCEEASPGGKIIHLPGIIVRCRLLLDTRDGRRIRYDFNPADSQAHFFEAKKRGAYFSARDELAVFDTLGLFRFAFRIRAEATENDARLLASPRAADEAPVPNAHAGDSNLKPEFSFQRTDNLVDNRPYVPGDDPRRINWKLYGHGSGLFVREGEREPPPHSHMAILVDTEFDPMLYDSPAARRGVDALCENALAAAIACTESGMDVMIGYTGAAQLESRPAKEFAATLAWPAARPFSPENAFPSLPDDRGILVLALPRTSAETSSLDRFLQNAANRRLPGQSRTIDVVFICGSPELAAAETCVALYNRRSGVRARIVGSGRW